MGVPGPSATEPVASDDAAAEDACVGVAEETGAVTPGAGSTIEVADGVRHPANDAAIVMRIALHFMDGIDVRRGLAVPRSALLTMA